MVGTGLAGPRVDVGQSQGTRVAATLFFTSPAIKLSYHGSWKQILKIPTRLWRKFKCQNTRYFGELLRRSGKVYNHSKRQRLFILFYFCALN